MNTTTTPQNPPLIKFETLIRDAGARRLRCAVLGALSDGTPRMVNEIAKMIGQKPGLVSKHLAVLRGAGMVVMNRRLYQVPAQYIAAADKRHLDFGHCLLRLPVERRFADAFFFRTNVTVWIPFLRIIVFERKHVMLDLTEI